jgi:hypothetical protein
VESTLRYVSEIDGERSWCVRALNARATKVPQISLAICETCGLTVARHDWLRVSMIFYDWLVASSRTLL